MSLALRPLGGACGAIRAAPGSRRLARPASRFVGQARSVVVRAEGDEPSTSTGASQPAEDLPPWVRREKERELAAASGKKGLPWPLYLVFSCLVAIASVGSIFEYLDRNAVFGVIQPDSPLWAPVLGLFAITGLPTAGFLFFKGVQAANEAAEMQDRIDGYIK